MASVAAWPAGGAHLAHLAQDGEAHHRNSSSCCCCPRDPGPGGSHVPVTVHCCHGSVQGQDCGQFRQEYCAVSEDSVIMVDTGVSSAQDCQVREEGARRLLDPVLCFVYLQPMLK